LQVTLRRFLTVIFFVLCAFFFSQAIYAQDHPGRPIGAISTHGNLIVMELDDGVLGHANLFDLTGHTLRFTPDGSKYRIENTAWHWDSEFGSLSTGAVVSLHSFSFPFSGKSWNSLWVGTIGAITFDETRGNPEDPKQSEEFIGRFDELAEAAASLVNTTPRICVFCKPRMSGPHYVKELSGRLVVTWNLTEPFGNIQDFTWSKTVNQFQAVLYRNGSIEMSYNHLAAKDAIVGVYPALSGAEKPLSEVHFSSLTKKDGPYAVAYEAFHYLALPHPEDLACTVIKALGDNFDFLAYYSDFRIDNQEAGTPSDGPLGGNVTGIGQTQHDLENYCSQGRFQWGFIQPVYAGSNQMQAWPAEGAPIGDAHDVTFYTHQLAERSLNGKMLPYNYAMSQLGHEMGHRWSAFVSAKVDGTTIPLGPVHWARGLQAAAAFPYQRPTEASAMGGGVWQDNFDGTYTQLDDDYYVPATGYSHLDLYLMGLISAAEVPDFFILRNLAPAGKDANGHPMFKAGRSKVTIQDVIAAEGARLPDVDHSQRKFNTGFVVVVEHGKKPSPELIERATGIREQWIDYWTTTTGHRSSMTANP
jgi:hypothetical protein